MKRITNFVRSDLLLFSEKQCYLATLDLFSF